MWKKRRVARLASAAYRQNKGGIVADKKGFTVAQHKEIGAEIKRLRADIKALTDTIVNAYPSPNNGFRNHAERQLDRARACLESVRGSADRQMEREHPYSYDKGCYQGEYQQASVR